MHNIIAIDYNDCSIIIVQYYNNYYLKLEGIHVYWPWGISIKDTIES